MFVSVPYSVCFIAQKDRRSRYNEVRQEEAYRDDWRGVRSY